MNAHSEFELLDEYVLGTLDASEAARVSEHLRTCESCRSEYEAIRSVVDVLPQALAPVSAPDALRDRILAAIDAPATIGPAAATIEPPLTYKLPLLPAALAAALLLALAGNVFLALRLAQRTDIAIATPTTVPATPPVARPARTARPTIIVKLAPASAAKDDKLVAALRTGRVYAIDGAVAGEPWHLTIVQPHHGEHALVYSGTPDAPSGKTYRTWVVRGRHTFDAGELPPGTPTTLEMPMALRTGDVVAFSLEPIGAGARPTTPFLMRLKIT